MEENMRSTIDGIKKEIREDGRHFVVCRRQTGKTTALLEIIHDDFEGDAILLSPNVRMSDYAKDRYREMYPGEKVPIFRQRADQTHGYALPVLVDEWLAFPESEQRNILHLRNLSGLVGSELYA